MFTSISIHYRPVLVHVQPACPLLAAGLSRSGPGQRPVAPARCHFIGYANLQAATRWPPVPHPHRGVTDHA
jgi:hypothetical protein